ncbi:hypothetical protein [Streptomyces liangshanensis]|uniref:Uncharacterized protein n=1 Tax=Streptomyces liangshanensis TaxID=2717324 RepID=A0A6G9GU59_9ACTN|nr:hypothetical protein [Streptomyces liangshanensis]QIQ01788.1 hypothetical protein HA039_05335 [Streptomyces liangshanensis]
MSSDSATPVTGAPPPAPTRVDRVITGLSVWWMASPAAFWFSLTDPSDRTSWETGLTWALSATALGGAFVAPVAGLVVALAGRRPGARRFAVMGAVSLAVIALLLLIFLNLDGECPPGDPC